MNHGNREAKYGIREPVAEGQRRGARTVAIAQLGTVFFLLHRQKVARSAECGFEYGANWLMQQRDPLRGYTGCRLPVSVSRLAP